ncbi:MAG: EAL domain-containing protein [Gallionella sp.]
MEDIELQNLLCSAINEASPEGILVVDDQGMVVTHNRRFLDVWQVSSEFRQTGSAVGKPDATLLPVVLELVAEPDAFLARVRQLYDNPHLDDHCELELRDGRTLERRSTVLRNGDGRYLGRVWFFLDITARKQIEAQLRINRFASEHAPECILWVDEQARIVYANDAACREYGYSKDELLGLTVIDLDHGARIEGWPHHWQRLRQKGSLTFETRHMRKDGSVFPIEVFTTLIEFEGRELIIGFFRDITERKQIEKKLLITQFVSDQAPDSIFWIDEQAHIVYVNEAACRERSFAREELLEMSITDINPDLPADVWVGHWQMSRQKGALTFESRHRRKDGSVFPVEVCANFVKFGGKEIVVAYVRNIAQRRKDEAELRIASVAFESQEILMITDADGVILRVNHAFTEDTGYTAEEVVGRTPRIFKSGRHDASFYREMWAAIKNEGKWQGEIWDKRKNGEIYPKWLSISAVKGGDGVVTHYVASHIDITERKAAEEEIQHLAFYDPLTRLPNRRLLMDRLQQAIASSTRSGRRGALLFIDLDNFKMLNDTLGHDIGDLLLQQVAQRLASCVREGDTVARLGGDEFMLILEGLSEHPVEAGAQTEAVSEKILIALSYPYRLAEYDCRSTPSIGATVFSGHQVSLEELMKQADIAMYQSKKAGRNTMRFFDPEMQAAINAHAALENELRLAIENRHFQLHYQVQVDQAQCVLGVEALIRWIHPERGMISPPHFIPLAEESGLILPIGRWVLETACAQLELWQGDTLTRGFAIAVNVSPKQFHQDGFAAEVQAAVTRHAIDPKLLKLELTESLLLDNVEEFIKTVAVLNDIGVQISMDDFGTGYSSLQYLKRLPLGQLKIDQSFVRDIASDSSDKAIVKTIIAMAQSMDLDVIAEGVETVEQWQILLDMGCKSFQGYLFNRPMPVAQFEAVLKKR